MERDYTHTVTVSLSLHTHTDTLDTGHRVAWSLGTGDSARRLDRCSRRAAAIDGQCLSGGQHRSGNGRYRLVQARHVRGAVNGTVAELRLHLHFRQHRLDALHLVVLLVHEIARVDDVVDRGRVRFGLAVDGGTPVVVATSHAHLDDLAAIVLVEEIVRYVFQVLHVCPVGNSDVVSRVQDAMRAQ